MTGVKSEEKIQGRGICFSRQKPQEVRLRGTIHHAPALATCTPSG